MSTMWIGIASTAVSAGTAIYSAKQSEKNANKLVDAQKRIATDIKYEPIDIAALKASATQAAIDNATQSLALERQLQPDVAAARDLNAKSRLELSRQVNEDLARGGNLSPDIINQVNSAGRIIGGRSGVGNGGTVPLTASLLGLNAVDLINQRRNAAAGLRDTQELPTSGLDPGAVASLEVAQNAAQNQFNLAKAGVDSNLAEGEAAARAAQIGGQTGAISSLAGLLGKGIGAYQDSRSGIGSAITKADYDKLYGTAPLYTPVDTKFSFS